MDLAIDHLTYCNLSGGSGGQMMANDSTDARCRRIDWALNGADEAIGPRRLVYADSDRVPDSTPRSLSMTRARGQVELASRCLTRLVGGSNQEDRKG